MIIRTKRIDVKEPEILSFFLFLCLSFELLHLILEKSSQVLEMKQNIAYLTANAKEQWNCETEHRKQPWVWQVCDEQLEILLQLWKLTEQFLILGETSGLTMRGMINVWCNIMWRCWIDGECASKGWKWSQRGRSNYHRDLTKLTLTIIDPRA